MEEIDRLTNEKRDREKQLGVQKKNSNFLSHTSAKATRLLKTLEAKGKGKSVEAPKAGTRVLVIIYPFDFSIYI